MWILVNLFEDIYDFVFMGIFEMFVCDSVANILFELDGISESVARESLRLAANKLPVRTRFITRHHAE
jgi:ribosomal protein L16/L10AE